MGFRMRMLHPDIWASATVDKLTDHQFRVYISLISHADDDGYFELDPALLRSLTFPRRAHPPRLKAFEDALDALIDAKDHRGDGLICAYIYNNQLYGHHPKWKKYQKPSHATDSKLPPCPKCHKGQGVMVNSVKDTGSLPEGSRKPPSQVRLGKVSLGKVNKDMSSQKEETTPVSKSIPPCPYKKIAEVWNKMAQEHKLPTTESIESRKGAMNTRWRDKYWRENWEVAIGLIPKQAWMLGDNDRNWKANIDYFLRPKTVATIIEAEKAADVQQSQKPFYEKGTKIKALTNRYRGIKVGSKGTVAGCFVSFPGTSGTHQGMAIHQEQIRENPYEWEIICKKA